MEQEAEGIDNGTSTPAVDELYRAVIGPKNQDYYLGHFQRFEREGKAGVSWHWPALFVTFYWLLYRKMWRNALVYFFLSLILQVLAVSSAGVLFFIVLGVLFFGPPLFVNAFYFRHCKRKIERAEVSYDDRERKLTTLSAKGGTSPLAVVVCLFLAFLGGLLSGIAGPAYHDYTIRARVAEAIMIGSAAAESVAQYYYQHEALPISLDQSGFAAPSSTSVMDVAVEDRGIVRITTAIESIEGMSILLVPALSENNEIVWGCLSEDMPDKFLPFQCRQQK
jgi:hypothetical protein